MKKYRNHVPSKLSRNTFLRKSLLCPKNVALSNISKFILFDFYSSHGKEIATGTIANVPLAAPLSLRPTDQDHSKHVAFEESSKKTDEDTGMILKNILQILQNIFYVRVDNNSCSIEWLFFKDPVQPSMGTFSEVRYFPVF